MISRGLEPLGVPGDLQLDLAPSRTFLAIRLVPRKQESSVDMDIEPPPTRSSTRQSTATP